MVEYPLCLIGMSETAMIREFQAAWRAPALQNPRLPA
jgi:hypothetical protein